MSEEKKQAPLQFQEVVKTNTCVIERRGAGMKAVLISIQPKWCEKIANGEKTIEVRKTVPSLERPFKCYIYETKGKYKTGTGIFAYGIELKGTKNGRGKVIGEFVCDRVDWYKYRLTTYEETPYKWKYISKEELAKTCLSICEINDYLNGKNGYFWHISQLKIYDKPKALSEFRKPCPYTDGTHCIENKCEYYGDWTGVCRCWVERPPQSWCYVEISE